MKRCISLIGSILSLVLLLGCNGFYREDTQEKMSENMRWSEQTYDMFFDCNEKYHEYEFSGTSSVGRIVTENKEIIFNVASDSSGNLYFLSVMDSEKRYQDLFTGRYISSSENTYTVKVDDSKIQDVLENGTILLFYIEVISPENLFIPKTWERFETAEIAGKKARRQRDGSFVRDTGTVLLEDTGTVLLKTRGRFETAEKVLF